MTINKPEIKLIILCSADVCMYFILDSRKFVSLRAVNRTLVFVTMVLVLVK